MTSAEQLKFDEAITSILDTIANELKSLRTDVEQLKIEVNDLANKRP